MNAPNGLPETHWYARPHARAWRCARPSAEPEALHRSMPGYQRTPLVECPSLADELGVRRLFVKDESGRLGLSAFKMLGASWAVFRAVGPRAGVRPAAPTLDALTEIRSSLGPLTLTTATDGNHGRAVARMASLIGAQASVYIPSEVDPAAISLIGSEGADVVVLDLPYDDVVRRAADAADGEPDSLLVQDTSWPGYEQVPQWIVDGYSTLFAEIDAQLAEQGAHPASLLTVPTGVGSLAQAAVAHYRSTDGLPAAVLVVEPESATCVGESLRQGRSVSVTTGQTAMDGLNCGTPSSIAWPYLRDGA
ncbi:MAG: pyridoxal-phosphate dependent enzyme, partial [Nocardioidaceae bacterium]